MDEFKYYLQIDYLKALAIIFVILLHTTTQNIVENLGTTFYIVYNFTILQAVPLFLIIMGRNTGASFKKRQFSYLSQIFSKKYFITRFERFVYPFILIFVLSVVLGFLLNKDLYFGYLSLIGYLPIEGAGNYFIIIIFQFIFIFPIIYCLYRLRPNLTLLISFITSIAYVIVGTKILLLYQAYIFNYLFIITLGLWTLDNFKINKLKDLFQKKLIIVGLIVSIFLLIIQSYQYTFPIRMPECMLSFYPLLIYLIGLKYLPKLVDNKLSDFIILIGRASYHIFLVQMIFFGIVGPGFPVISIARLFSPNYYIFVIILSIIVNLAICLGLGLLFFKIEPKSKNIIKDIILTNKIATEYKKRFFKRKKA